MTTNSDMIKEAYRLFSEGNHSKCESLLKRIEQNFEIEDDEYTFTIRCELYQPLKAMAEQLIADDKAELIGDDNYRQSKLYLRHDLKMQIKVEGKYPYGERSTGHEDDEGKHVSEPVYFSSRISLDAEGEIGYGTMSSGKTTRPFYMETLKTIENWLKDDFGCVPDRSFVNY